MPFTSEIVGSVLDDTSFSYPGLLRLWLSAVHGYEVVNVLPKVVAACGYSGFLPQGMLAGLGTCDY
jgi:hypothetical protein